MGIKHLCIFHRMAPNTDVISAKSSASSAPVVGGVTGAPVEVNAAGASEDLDEEEVVIYQKFGEMELPEDEDADDVDYVPSDADSEDSLEWSSETERTKAEDALAEGAVGLDFYNAAFSVVTEYVASYTPVQMGLSVATIVPVSSIQRAARAARRAGAKNLEVIKRSAEPSMVMSLVNSILDIFGLQLVSAVEDSSKPHLEPGTEPFTPEQEFGKMTLSDYDSDEDADYVPDESEETDALEYNSDVSVSSSESVTSDAEVEEAKDIAEAQVVAAET